MLIHDKGPTLSDDYAYLANLDTGMISDADRVRFGNFFITVTALFEHQRDHLRNYFLLRRPLITDSFKEIDDISIELSQILRGLSVLKLKHATAPGLANAIQDCEIKCSSILDKIKYLRKDLLSIKDDALS